MIIEQTKEQFDGTISFHTHSELIVLRLARACIWSRERITQITGRKVDFDIRKPDPPKIENAPVTP